MHGRAGVCRCFPCPVLCTPCNKHDTNVRVCMCGPLSGGDHTNKRLARVRTMGNSRVLPCLLSGAAGATHTPAASRSLGHTLGLTHLASRRVYSEGCGIAREGASCLCLSRGRRATSRPDPPEGGPRPTPAHPVSRWPPPGARKPRSDPFACEPPPRGGHRSCLMPPERSRSFLPLPCLESHEGVCFAFTQHAPISFAPQRVVAVFTPGGVHTHTQRRDPFITHSHRSQSSVTRARGEAVVRVGCRSQQQQSHTHRVFSWPQGEAATSDPDDDAHGGGRRPSGLDRGCSLLRSQVHT